MLVEEVYQRMTFAEKKHHELFFLQEKEEEEEGQYQIEEEEPIGLSFYDDNDDENEHEQQQQQQQQDEEEEEEEEEAVMLSSVAMGIAQSTARFQQQQSILWNSLPRKQMSNYHQMTKRRGVSFSLLPQKKLPIEHSRRKRVEYPPPKLTSIQKAASYHGLRQIPCSPPVPIPPSQWKRRSSTSNTSPRRLPGTMNSSNLMESSTQEEARFWDENWHFKLSFESRESFAFRQKNHNQNQPQQQSDTSSTSGINTTLPIKGQDHKGIQDKENQQAIDDNDDDDNQVVFDMDDI